MSKQIIDLGEAARADEETFNEEPTCKKCDCFITVDSGDEVTPYCNDCAHTLVEDFEKREPLVQDVLTKHDALTQCVLHGDGDCENEDAALFEALEKLRKWSPT